MSYAIRMHETGGPEVLVWEQVPTPEPGPGQVLIKHAAIGLNFIDVYFRSGLYKMPLPATPGIEASGTILAVGAGVTTFAVGDRVAYSSPPIGAYAERRVMPADRLVKLPDDISFDDAAAMMMAGMTSYYLIHRTFRVTPSVTILVHAAAGGVGLVLCEWARYLGANVIGVVSTPEKGELARAHGATDIILTTEDLPARVKTITEGAMVPVVYDSVGKETFLASLDCLAPLGMMVSYGSASGPVQPLEIATLGAKGSLFLTRPSLATYTAKREDLDQAATAVFGAIRSGAVKVRIGQRFALKDTAEAHRALESRSTTGSTILLP
jgi:NADPH:quinone reductase